MDTITLDEAVYAGLIQGTSTYNITNYLKSNYIYWTISPKSSGNQPPLMYVINPNGGHSEVMSTSTYYAAPVIIMKPTTIVASGTGKFDDPYVIN